MADDREVLREVWESCLPVSFSLSPEEVVTMQRPDPFYLMVPRVSYFPLVMDRVIKYFARFVADTCKHSHDLWLDYEGQKLKWHNPIGLLFDMYVTDSSSPLPWNITVHFTDFPEQDLVRCNTRPAMESYFLATVKEADVLKHRGDIMSNLQKRDHNSLWTGLVNHKFDQFWLVNKKLMSSTPFRCIPIRFYLPSRPAFVQKLIKCAPVPASGDNAAASPEVDRVITLHDVLSPFNYFQNHEKSDGTGSPDSTSDSAAMFEKKLKILTHGHEVPAETPIQWMSEHLSYPDNFIHLCIHSRE